MTDSHIIEIDPALQRRIQTERRKDVRERLARCERTIEWLHLSHQHWLAQLETEMAKQSHALRLVVLHQIRDTLELLGEEVGLCSCAYCVEKREKREKEADNVQQ